MSVIIAISTVKGGVGKTATTQELACCFTDMGKRVLCIDFDPQGDLTQNTGANQSNTIIDIFKQDIKIREGIQHFEWYDLIPADSRIQMMHELFPERDDIYLLADVCEILQNDYDYILIDNPPAKNLGVIMSYVAADYVIAPTLSDDNSMKGVVSAENDIEKMRASRNKESHAYLLCIILTKYKQTGSHARAVNALTKFAEAIPGKTFIETVRDSIKVVESRTKKLPMQRYQKYNNVSVDYRRIAKRIDEEIKTWVE